MFFLFGLNVYIAILVILAIGPAIALMVYVYRHDRLEPESLKLLITLAILGVVATFFASLTEALGLGILGTHYGDEPDTLGRILLYFVVVGLSEEGIKYLLMRWRTWKNPEFNCSYDGVVYAVCVSLGFAVAENIQYILRFGISTAFIRAVTAIPGHACFAIFMGAWYGLAKRYDYAGDKSFSRVCRIMAVVFPVLLHGAYDYIATMTSPLGTLAFLAFIAVLFFVSFRMVKKLSANDRYIDGSGNDDSNTNYNVIDV